LPAETQHFRQLFLDSTPLLDVRAPVEFNKGAFPQSTNLPLLDDKQREVIGIEYTERGQDAAIALGNELATPEIRQQRLDAWAAFIKQHTDAHLYCFRGGLRSRTTQAWLAEQGIDITLLTGGYKAMRRFLIEELEEQCANAPMLLLAGPTGSGKTVAIQAWEHSLDLEGKALHRGSAFGGTFVPQPSQIDWEHQITIDWMRRREASDHPVLVEAESQLIGRIYLPDHLQETMARAPVAVLDVPMQDRVELLRHDYVLHALTQLGKADDGDPWEQLESYVADNLKRIRRRLGGERCDQLVNSVPGAVKALRDAEDWGGFDHIIATLLTDYYDKLYAHKMTERLERSVFRGDRTELAQWLAEQYG